ncbi:DUF58 domain-containing protein [Saccharibacillus sp. CPCC 101409]|uniref:DUF58 domain-containing protein n=1 Tax=Saccharibacillus sp. CPCC 101409 TaxID=3058041 RepID=UPI0026719F36|nr:DUF58 domain-containing protein [Saccharibacillus sp. CPCC 101409]MDO3408751.1 DUF58 domain-containing protein [Saccharibacillus sp. CPCC 101409]
MALLGFLIVVGLIVYLQGLVLGKPALSRIDYERTFSKTVCRVGESIEMVETIANRKPLPVPWLRLEAMLPSALSFARSGDTNVSEGAIYQNHTSLFTLPPLTRITRTHRILCGSRGIFPIETATMTGGDLFGLYASSRQVHLQMRMVIQPKMLGDGELPMSWKTWQGELAVRRWIVEDPFLMNGVREYAQGDPMNRIHWKASARTGQLQVHKSGYSADPRVIILLNVEDSETMWSVVTRPALIERQLSLAATCAATLIGQGMSAGFAHNADSQLGGEGQRLEPDYGPVHLNRLLEAMAAFEMKSRLPFHELLHLEAGREFREPVDYLLITTHRSAKVEEGIAELEKLGHRVGVTGLSGDSAARRPGGPFEDRRASARREEAVL